MRICLKKSKKTKDSFYTEKLFAYMNKIYKKDTKTNFTKFMSP